MLVTKTRLSNKLVSQLFWILLVKLYNYITLLESPIANLYMNRDLFVILIKVSRYPNIPLFDLFI